MVSVNASLEVIFVGVSLHGGVGVESTEDDDVENDLYSRCLINVHCMFTSVLIIVYQST